jgi:hypothetical protein
VPIRKPTPTRMKLVLTLPGSPLAASRAAPDELRRRQHLRRDPALLGAGEPQRQERAGQQEGQQAVDGTAPRQRRAPRRAQDVGNRQDCRHSVPCPQRDATGWTAFGRPLASDGAQ